MRYRLFVFRLYRNWLYHGRCWTLFIAFGFHGELAAEGELAPCRLAIELTVQNPFSMWVRRDGHVIEQRTELLEGTP